MDPPKNRMPRVSGIPRASMLPVATSFGKSFGSSVSDVTTLPRKDTLAYNSEISTVLDKGLAKPPLHGSSKARPPSDSTQANTLVSHKSPKATLNSTHRKARPSLSDRTVETLAQIPPSPSPRRRKSSFFTSESPMTTPTRSTSSLNHSRPSTSASHYPPLPTGFPSFRPSSPTKRHLAPTTGNKTPVKTPSQRAVSSFVPRSLPTSQSKVNGPANDTPSKIRRNPSLTIQQEDGEHSKAMPILNARGSRTLAARPSRTRAPVKDAFVKPGGQASGESGQNGGKVCRSVDKRPPSTKEPCEDARKSQDLVPSPAERPTPPKSSAALRETIAKAKAARRALSQTHDQGPGKAQAITEDFSGIEIEVSNKVTLRNRISSARSDGRLNIAAMGLRNIPTEILNMYDMSDMTDGTWAESVDLVKLIAADNEIHSLDDNFFPIGDTLGDADNDHPGSIFGGLEVLDLHGNVLEAISPGIAAMKHLTTMNVSKNRLDNHCLSTIGRIKNLRELRIADNEIKGCINPEVFNASSLEILDLSKNGITEFPSTTSKLSNLRALLLSANRLSSLPEELFTSMSLRELDVSRNCLKGYLFPIGANGSTTMKSLDVSYNALTSISEDDAFSLPVIQILNVSENRIKNLPDLSSWTNLITLTADGNQIADIPDGMTILPLLKNVDFARNDIRHLDEQIGLMDKLSVLRVANNPLRERRLLNMNTEDLKHELRSRLNQTDSANNDQDLDNTITDTVDCSKAPASKAWPVQIGGSIDRSSSNLQTVEASDLEPLIESYDIKSLSFHHNALNTIPFAIGLIGDTLSTLDISHNKLTGGTYLPIPLSLPKLRSLNISVNALSSLSPLLECLTAPALTELNISRNRLSNLPILRSAFPALTSVLASDNSITDLPIDSVRGLHILDVGSNDISFLKPKLGLLSHEGLQSLLVGANRFRVPRKDVVEKGTEAILAWLRGRIPDDEM